MVTGTPLDLTPFGSVLEAVGWIYWAVGAGALWLALRVPRANGMRVGLSLLILVVFITGPAMMSFRRATVQRTADQFAEARLDAARLRFDLRCKQAGERIRQTVEGVEGVVMLNLRPKTVNYSDQFGLDDPYGTNCTGDSCIAGYLFDYKMVPSAHGGLEPTRSRIYWFVDVVAADGWRYRYTKDAPDSELKRAMTSEPQPRYGVAWSDVSTIEDRELWIAGGSIKVIDLSTNEVIAERIGFLMDEGQGAQAGGRSPWHWARTGEQVCPPVPAHNVAFVARVVKPSGGVRQ